MKKIYYFLLILLIFLVGCASDPLVFNIFQDELPYATVGETYKYSFCRPEVTSKTDLCGAFEDNIRPSGGNPPYHFQLEQGFPPFGLNLNLNGLLEGIPTADGKREFSICAVDESGEQVCEKVILIVKEKPSVKIESTDCTILRSINKYQNIVKKEASGTASGPIGALITREFHVFSLAGSDEAKASCGDWTNSGSSACKRQEGDPSTTSWTFSIETVFDTTDLLSVTNDGPGYKIFGDKTEVECPKK